MAEQIPASETANPQDGDAIQRWSRLAEQSQRVSEAFWRRQAASASGKEFSLVDPLAMNRAFAAFVSALWSDPDRLSAATAEYWRRNTELWQESFARLRGDETSDGSPISDRRFRGEKWEEHALYDHMRRAYLLCSDWLGDLIKNTEGMDDKDQARVAFLSRQFVSAASPANFAATNPEVLARTLETGGENLVKGLEHLLADLEKGQGELQISMTDESAFTVGGNVAATPGEVIFQNDLMQLIQYRPATDTVSRRPLLFVPPWINKFYVMDLRPKNSLVRWAVAQGHTVFMISWVNPDERHAGKSFDDYLREGPLAAMDAIEKATGESEVNILGFCIGGILVATLLACLGARGDKRIASATMLATLFEFEDVGEVSVFLDETQIEQIEAHAADRGYLEGKHIKQMFSMMRENDLIWSFVVSNYLLGREPIPFDLLYWNADSTNLPATMLAFYLRKFYVENGLTKPDHIELDGTGIDLGKVAAPCYVLATKEDHIAPWRSSYPAIHHLGAPCRFVLGGSGHIAGVINSPSADKYCYWTREEAVEDPDSWLAGADRHPGSWWIDWGEWLASHAGGEAPARVPGEGALPILEPAPGSFVLKRSET